MHVVTISILFTILFTASLNQKTVADDGVFDIPTLFDTATQKFMIGQYSDAIILYDRILEISPNHTKTLLMKGTALSNQEQHKNSILAFNKVLQNEPENVMALLGVGVGYGNFGEYKQAHKYFLIANEVLPENHIVKKSGTPTMGGVIIIIGIISSTLLWADLKNIYVWKDLEAIMDCKNLQLVF